MAARLNRFDEYVDLAMFVAQCAAFIGIWSVCWPPVWR